MNILVIDDQKKVVDSICAGIDWERLGVLHVYGAYSAEEARRIIRNHAVDLLLSDIEMPEESGLELFSWVREQGYDIDCIFLTSHADFSYAKEAIHLGSVDYILQPARLEDIEEALRRHIEQRKARLRLKELEKSQKLLKEKEYVLIDKTFESLLNTGFQGAEEQGFDIQSLCHRNYLRDCFYIFSIQIMRWVKPEWGEQLVRMVFANVIGELFENCECEVLIGGILNTDYVVLLHGNADTVTEAVIRENIRTMFWFIQEKMDFKIAVYQGGFIRESIHQCLEKIRYLMKNNVLQKEEIFETEGRKEVIPVKTDCLHIDRWGALLEEGSGNVIQKEVERYFVLNEDRLNHTAVKNLYLEYSKVLFHVVNQKKYDVNSFFTEDYTYDDFCHSYTTCAGFLQAIEYTGGMLKRNEEDTEDNRLVKAQQYITENISKNISRAEVANYLYLSEEYFSRWFSRETGDSFKNYVLNQKIDYAKQLLENTNFTVGIIASKIGCDNFSYFSKLFKKKVGVTPQDYRQNCQNREIEE